LAKGIYKRGKIYWIRYAGPDGKVIFESTKGTSFKDAETLFLKRKKEVRDGELQEIVKKPDITFNELAAEYEKWAERQRGIRQKRGRIKQLKKAFGPIQLRHFNTRMLEQFQTERLQKGDRETEDKKPIGNKPATINRILGVLRHMFTKAVDWGMVSDDVLKRVRKARPLEENNARLRFLSKEECQTLTAACDDHLQPIVITALHTGARKSEILKLRWDQVDLKHGFILFKGSMAKNGERREVPINDTLRTTLSGIVRRIDLPFVFYNPGTDEPYTMVARSFASTLKKAKITDFRFHDLRHTFASHLAMSGVELITIKKLLGHKDITMTLRYAHLAPAQKKRAVHILDTALNGAADSTIQKLYNLPMVEDAR
jgi:integrase